MALRKLSVLLAVLALAASLVRGAVPVNEEQKQILYELRDQWPVLARLPQGAWTDEAIEDACMGVGRLGGVIKCDEEGWVNHWRLSCSDDPSHIYLNRWAPAFGRMSRLRIVEDFLCLRGPLDPSWSTLANLETLNIGNDYFSGNPHRVTGSLPDSWSAMSRMKSLRIAAQPFMQVSIPTWLNEDWPLLETLNFDGVGMTGGLPASLSSHPALTSLRISNCTLQGKVPESFATNAPILHDLRLASTNLKGPLPLDWTGAPRLKLVYIENNDRLNGRLPKYWPNDIELLSLHDNAFSGALPSSWTQLSKLYSLNLAYNQLTGELPQDWSKMTSLSVANLAGNSFSDLIPASFWELYHAHLRTVRIEENSLELCSSAGSYIDTTIYADVISRIQDCDVGLQNVTDPWECNCRSYWDRCLERMEGMCLMSNPVTEAPLWDPIPYAAGSLYELSLALACIASAVFMLTM